MRTFFSRGHRVLTMLATVCLTLALAACDPPWRAEIGADGAEAEFGSTQSALDAFAKHHGDAAASGICAATDLSTVLDPVPPSTGTSPVNVRIHYRRDDAQYGDWGLHLWQVNDAGQYIADYPGVNWNAPFARTGIDSYGAYFDLPAAAFDNPAAAGFGFIVHPPGQGGDPGVDRVWKFADGGEFWLRSGDSTVYRSNPLTTTPDVHTVRVHYKRFDGAFDQWGLHLWPSSGIDVARLPGLTLDQWGNPVPLSAMPAISRRARTTSCSICRC